MVLPKFRYEKLYYECFAKAQALHLTKLSLSSAVSSSSLVNIYRDWLTDLNLSALPWADVTGLA